MPGPDAGELTGALADKALTPLHSMPVPHLIALALAAGLAVWSWRSGEIRKALLGLSLVALAVGFNVFTGLRSYQPHYLVYTEGWPILAIAILSPPLWQTHRRALAAVLAALVFYQAVQLATTGLLVPQPPDNACKQAGYMTIRDGFCR